MVENLQSAHEDITFVKLNVDESPGTVTFYAIQAVPTVLIFRDGVLLDHVGPQRVPKLAVILEGYKECVG